MSPKTAARIEIVRLEDKETKLKTFIKSYIEEAAARSGTLSGASSDTTADQGVLLLVLRSLDSPVAKAISALVKEGMLDMPIKAIFAVVPRGELDAEPAEELTFPAANAVRMARDPRLLDVHEQLVLGPSTTWIGDCMRRDPRKRDAYECYAADCIETARWARISFERLWQRSEAIVISETTGIATATAEACASVAAEVKAPARETSTAS